MVMSVTSIRNGLINEQIDPAVSQAEESLV